MAIPIKAVPRLEGKAARDFIMRADAALSERGSISFSKEVQTLNKILEKAQLK
jgi:hypothetical protein